MGAVRGGFWLWLWSLFGRLFARAPERAGNESSGTPRGEFKMARALRSSGASVPWGGYYFRSSTKKRWKLARQRG